MGKEKRKRVEGEDKSPDTENKKRKEDKKHEKNQKTGALEIMGEDKPHVRPKGDSAKSEGIEDKSKGTLDNSQNHMEENRQLSASTDKDQAKLAKKARKLAHRAERQGKAAEVDPKSKAFAYLKEKGGVNAVVTPAQVEKHPFQVDPKDHAETPFEAYRDLEPILYRMALSMGKTKSTLKIYDPFYCAGSVITHLGRLGFTNVYNKCEDFYSVLAANDFPEFDVVITNPPFSGDHIQKTLEWLCSTGKPWFALLPDFSSQKGGYKRLIKDGRLLGKNIPLHKAAMKASIVTNCKIPEAFNVDAPANSNLEEKLQAGLHPELCVPPMYLGPKSKPYVFSAPGRDILEKGLGHDLSDSDTGIFDQSSKESGKNKEGFQSDHSEKDEENRERKERAFSVFATSFQCVWYIQLGPAMPAIYDWYKKKQEGAAKCIVEAKIENLPQLARDQLLKRRLEDKERRAWRKKLSRQRKKLVTSKDA